MDTAEEVRMNLASLQRIDPYIISIKESASQVALYRYSATQEWEKTETEGTLFVYERKCEPMYGFLILNRLSTNNWIQPITSEIDSQLQAPFLLYKTKDDEILGLWFENEDTCEIIAKTIDNLVKMTLQNSNQTKKNLIDSKKPECNKGDNTSNLVSYAAAVSHKEKSSDDLYTEEDIKIMAGEKSLPAEPKKSVNNSSAGSVAQFFAQACQQEQQQQDVGPNQINEQSHPKARSNENEVKQPQLRTTKAEPVKVIEQHPTGAFVSGGPPGMQFPISTSSGQLPGIVPIIPGGIPGMALLPPHPGVPPIMVPINPSTEAQMMHQHQIRLAVAHAQAAAAAHSIKQMENMPGINYNTQRSGIANIADSNQNIPGQKNQDNPPAVSPQLPALETLLSNPAAMSVESLERAHREESRTPPNVLAEHRGSSKETEIALNQGKTIKATNLEVDLRSKLHISQEITGGKINNSNGMDSRDKASYAGAAKSPNKRSQPKVKHPVHEVANKPDKANEKTPGRNQYLKREEIETEEVQLLSPMVFSQPVNGHLSSNANDDASHLKTNIGGVTPLTENQLSQALQHLLKTDPSFVGKLHVAYVESLNSQLN